MTKKKEEVEEVTEAEEVQPTEKEEVEEVTEAEEVQPTEKEEVEKASKAKDSKDKETEESMESNAKDDVNTGPSKFPDFSEIISMGKTLFCSVQTGVKTIISDYKAKRK